MPGTVDTFDREGFKAGLATLVGHGVTAADITLRVTAASVRVRATIQAASDEITAAEKEHQEANTKMEAKVSSTQANTQATLDQMKEPLKCTPAPAKHKRNAAAAS